MPRAHSSGTIRPMTLARSYTPYHPGLLTDLYHPDSAYVAWRAGRSALTTFDLYARRAPFGGAYLLVAGLEMALEFVRSFRYSDEDIAFLQQIRDYDPAFLEHLQDLRFSGEILAMPEGSIAFPNEPLLRVTAPFDEALLLESGLLQAINLATLIATKASRVVWAARGRPVAEFSLRRAQDPFVATRSSRIGGCFSTSFLGAAFRFRLPSTGTVPHALIQLFDTEHEAFEAIADTYNRYTLLLDTYDPRAAIHTAVDVAHAARDRLGHVLAGDSPRQRRPAAAMRATSARCSIGPGCTRSRSPPPATSTSFRSTSCWTPARRSIRSASAPAWASARARSSATSKAARWAASTRRSSASTNAAGTRKSKWPATRAPGRASKRSIAWALSVEDVIQLADEPKPHGSERLLKPVVLEGEVVPGSLPPLSEIWEFAQSNLRRLPDEYRQLVPPTPYPVHISEAFAACATAPSPSSAGSRD